MLGKFSGVEIQASNIIDIQRIQWRKGSCSYPFENSRAWPLFPLPFPTIDSATRFDLLEIIDDRAASKATIITSQLPIEHWHTWIGDATIADAILDRIMQRHHRFTLTGDSRRPEKQKPTKTEKTIDPS